MTLRKSSPMAASTAMTGDYVRITSPMGATFPMLGHRGDHLVNGAFGQVILRDEGRFLKLSEFMPAEIGALQEIQLKAATVVERLIVDDPKELALAGFDYLFVDKSSTEFGFLGALFKIITPKLTKVFNASRAISFLSKNSDQSNLLGVN